MAKETKKTVRRATMREIGRRAGVSPTVVSHVLNNTAGAQVAEQTRKKVLRMAKESGYQESLLARSIKTPLRHLGIAVAAAGAEQIQQIDTVEIFEGIRDEASERGYSPVMQPMPTRPGQSDASDAIQRMIQLHRMKLLSGFIVDKQSFPSVFISRLYDEGVPVVTVHGSPESCGADGKPVPSAVIDNAIGGYQATRHLVELGHRDIALITRPYQRYKIGNRPDAVAQVMVGYHKALQESNLPVREEYMLDGDSFHKGLTYRAVDRLLACTPRPTAFFVGDDVMAVMVMQKLRLLGLNVPEDISVVGYGDWALPVRLSEPSLTTVHAPLRANGRFAARMLIELVEGGEVSPRQISLGPHLVVRESSSDCLPRCDT